MIKTLNSFQIEQLRQISDYLLQVRQKQSISLEAIAHETFIPLRLLQALEAGEIERLPEPIYIKGFIRRYADVVGLDGAEIADAFEIDPTPAPEPEPVTSDAAIAPASSTPSPQSLSMPSLEVNRSIVVYAVAGLVAVGAIGAIAYGAVQMAQRKPNPSAPAETTPPASPSLSDAAQSSPSPHAAPTAPSAGKTAAPTVAGAPVQVSVNLTGRSWMEVVVDGQRKFEGTLEKGEQRTWTAQKSLKLTAGNAGAVVVSYNQGAAKPLGKLGEVVDVKFPKTNQPPQSGDTAQ